MLGMAWIPYHTNAYSGMQTLIQRIVATKTNDLSHIRIRE